MRKFARRIRVIATMMYRADRKRLAIYLVTSMIDPAMPLMAALMVKLTVNAVIDGQEDRALTLAVVLGLIAPLPFLVKRVRSREAFVLIDKTTARYDESLIAIATSVPYIEDTERRDYLDRMEQLRYRPAALGENSTMISVLLWGSLQALLLIALLISVHPFLLVLPIAALPGVWIARRTQQRHQRAFEAASVHRRRANEVFELAVSPRYADEMRTLRATTELLRHHRDACQTADHLVNKANRVNVALTMAGRLLFTIGYVAATALVIRRGFSGDATAGDVVLTVVLASTISQQMFTLIDAVGRLTNALGMIDRYLWLVDYAERTAATVSATHAGAAPDVIRNGIRLRNVSYRYPGATRDALRNIDLDLPAGAVVAIIGENGAGKTTLTKLLTRLHEPTEGTISVDDTRIADIDLAQWRARCATAFQDFARIEAALGEAVGIGDLPNRNNEALVSNALDRAGAAELPGQLRDGTATLLGSSFDDGVALSGGQWQRVALGRTMMRPTPLVVILDEPAANLDPAAEAALFERHASHARATAAANGTISLLVSHRFSTVRGADLIIVIGDAQIAEIGSHDELLARNGTYAELYEMQASHYRM